MGPHSGEETLCDMTSLHSGPVIPASSSSAPLTVQPVNHLATRKRSFSSAKKLCTNGLHVNHHAGHHSLHLSRPDVARLNEPAMPTPPLTPPLLTRTQSLTVECHVRARIPTATGEFFLHVYKNNRDNKEHLAIVYGNDLRSRTLDSVRPGETEADRILRGVYADRLRPGRERSEELSTTVATGEQEDLGPPLVRIHSECFTGETVQSARCDCGEQLKEAMQLIQREGRGVVVYLRQEGRGIGLAEKLRAYNLQDLGHDTVTANLLLHHPPDLRTYDIAARILADFGLTRIRLLTNNPDKIKQLEHDGLRVAERVPMIPRAWQLEEHDPDRHGNEVDHYLKVKVERMGHLLNLPEALLH